MFLCKPTVFLEKNDVLLRCETHRVRSVHPCSEKREILAHAVEQNIIMLTKVVAKTSKLVGRLDVKPYIR